MSAKDNHLGRFPSRRASSIAIYNSVAVQAVKSQERVCGAPHRRDLRSRAMAQAVLQSIVLLTPQRLLQARRD